MTCRCLFIHAPRATYQYDAESIRVTFYADGMAVRSEPFRPYADKAAMNFINDVLDGYLRPRPSPTPVASVRC